MWAGCCSKPCSRPLYVDVALVGVREARLRETHLGEPRFVDLNNQISDDVASRIDLAQLHDRYVS